MYRVYVAVYNLFVMTLLFKPLNSYLNDSFRVLLWKNLIWIKPAFNCYFPISC